MSLESLREQCKVLGIKYSPNAKEEKLQELIDNFDGGSNITETDLGYIKEEPKEVKKVLTKAEIYQDQTQLVRFTLHCNDSNDRTQGYCVGVGNMVTGLYRLFIPYDTPWHAPKVVVEHLKNEQLHESYFDETNNKRVSRLRPKFNVQELPPLTPEELEALKKEQLITGRTKDED